MKPARGYVLISVLWVVALLTVITLSYHHRAGLEVRAARYSLDSSQCMLAARGAVERGIVALRNKEQSDRVEASLSMISLPPVTHLGQAWAQPHNLYAEGNLLSEGPEFAEDMARLQIEDQERYIDINSAPERLLENVPGMSIAVLRRLNFRRTGLGDDGVRAASGPAAFHDIAELRQLRGVDAEAWFGEDGDPGIRDVLAVTGDGRVNVNTAGAAVLGMLPDVGEAAVASILAYRNGEDGAAGTADDRGFRDWTMFSAITGITGDTLRALQQHCKFDSDYFKITGVATRRGGKIRASCAAVVRIPNGSDVASLILWTEETLGTQ